MPTRLRPSSVVWPAFIATRLVVLLAGWLALDIVGFRERPVFRVSDEPHWNMAARWDAGWYLGIARGGYRWQADRQDRQQNIAFFPAFPVLMRVAGEMVTVPARIVGDGDIWGGGNGRVLLGGVLVSLVAFWWALHYLFRLGALYLPEDQAARAVALAAAYPFGVFFGAPYTESLFLLSTVAAFFHLRREQPIRAFGWGMLAGLTRPNGLLLSVPLFTLLLAPRLRWPRLRRGRVRQKATAPDVSIEPSPPWKVPVRSPGPSVGALLAATAPVCGMLVFSAYLGYRFGHPFLWTQAQAAWGRTYQGTLIVTRRYDFIVDQGLYAYAMRDPIDVLSSALVLFCLVMLWPIARRLGVAYAVFVLVNLLPPLLIDLPAIGRMTAVLFPLFLGLAAVLSPPRAQLVAAIWALLQGLGAVLFYTWRPFY